MTKTYTYILQNGKKGVDVLEVKKANAKCRASGFRSRRGNDVVTVERVAKHVASQIQKIARGRNLRATPSLTPKGPESNPVKGFSQRTEPGVIGLTISVNLIMV